MAIWTRKKSNRMVTYELHNEVQKEIPMSTSHKSSELKPAEAFQTLPSEAPGAGESPIEVAASNFSADDSPFNEFGERRFVTRLSWFGPLNLVAVLAFTIPTAATAALFSFMYTVVLPESQANTAIGITNVFGAFVGAIFAVLIGFLSDRTHTRMGRRNPWILSGAAICTLGLVGLAFADYTAIWSVVLFFCIFQAGLNTFYAAYTALLPDRVHSSLLGRASAYSGFGSLAGTALGSILTQVLVSVFGSANLKEGFLTLPWLMIIIAIVIVIVLPGADLRAKQNDRDGALASVAKSQFRIPKDRDFWLAYFGRFAIVLGVMLILQTATQILRYHLGLSVAGAASVGAVAGLLMAGAGAVSSLFAGFISDKIGKRKPLIAFTVAFFILGAALLAFSNSVTVYYLYTICAALSYGSFQAIDQALMVEVLPDKEHVAQDMGMLGTTNTLTGVIAGGLGALLIGVLGYEMLFVISGVLAFIGILIFIPIKRVK